MANISSPERAESAVEGRKSGDQSQAEASAASESAGGRESIQYHIDDTSIDYCPIDGMADVLPHDVPESPESLELVEWAVIGIHGSSQAVPVAIASHGHVESRGVEQMRLKVTFNMPLDPATLGGDVLSIDGQTGGNITLLVGGLGLDDAGRSLVFELMSPLPDGDRYTLTLSQSLRDIHGRALQSQAVAELAVLTGDADGSGVVTAADLALIKEADGKTLTGETAGFDIDGSGTIDHVDLADARHRLGRMLP